MASVVQLNDVSKTFRTASGGRVDALAGVSLTVERGECVGVIGESGSGKTTLGKTLLGLLPPDSGEVRISGEDAYVSSRHRAADTARIQAVFQEPYESLNPSISIRRTLAEPLLNQRPRLDRVGRERRIHEVLELIGLSPRILDRRPAELSGGQQQRVGIARALMTKPEVIVFDEPTSSLDLSVQAQILQVLIDLRQELSTAFVYISHDITTVDFLCDRLYVMYKGAIVEHGTTDSVIDTPRHPYTRSLLGAVVRVYDGGATGYASLHEPAVTGDVAEPLSCNLLERCPDAGDACGTWQSRLVLVPGSAEHAVRCVRYGSSDM